MKSGVAKNGALKNGAINVVLFGPQGCGKGTQAELLAKKYGLYHLSVGDELRKEAKKKTSQGKKIASMINEGIIVPESITISILRKISKKSIAKKGIIFDGYPRTLSQYFYLKKHFKINAAIEISITDKDSMRRIMSRRVCPKCKMNYNTIWLKPKVKGRCDSCKVDLIMRADDRPVEIRRRLKTYHKMVSPIKNHYKKQHVFYFVDGKKSIKEVHKSMCKIISGLKKNY